MLTDNEIIKALECCSGNTIDDCDDCPRFCDDSLTSSECMCKLMRNALDLINRQKAEIEALIAGQETLQKNLAKVIKAEAVKEVAERLTFEIVNKPSEFKAVQATPDFLNGMTHRQHEILDIIKEMAGDDK